MRVFKFGGASVKDASAVRNLLHVLEKQERAEKLLIVISAMGKMTNAFEALFEAAWDKKNYSEEWNYIKEYHFGIMENLFEDFKKNEEHHYPENHILSTLFQEIEEILQHIHQKKQSHDQAYDSLIVYGELISTTLVSAFLKAHLPITWLDAREVIHTDSQWREATLDWGITEKNIKNQVLPLLKESIVLTQGFIGKTAQGESTTLGREGSDYSAAIFAYCLEADSVVIWKDVPGVLNADPKTIKNTSLFSQLSFQEAAEMSYLGATVIHPKTIAPLEKKNISLYVKSFLDPVKPGTCIDKTVALKALPGIIFKPGLHYLELKKKTFGFSDTKDLEALLPKIKQAGIELFLIQLSIRCIALCVSKVNDAFYKELKILEKEFEISQQPGVILISITHPDAETIQSIKKDKQILLEQFAKDLYQAVSVNKE